MEIEKKFRLKRLPDSLDNYEKKVIEQGYLCVDPVVRIRKSNDRYILTYKSRIGLEQSDGVRINNEVEVPLTKDGYEHLRAKVDDHLIQKIRYIVPLPDGHTGELDVFDGVLKGLQFIEVEFSSEEDAEGFVPPEWFGDNVSDDKRYSNSFLSKCENLDVFEEK
ncbi:MAG: CYTH domain-containing protein [Lachnospiraceae bacterium]|nr:CYTH domain-containing protein [Lachnospiraceae bacterium]